MVNSLIRLVEAKFGDDPLKNPPLLSFCRHLWTAPFPKIHAFFYKQHFYKQRQAGIGKKSSEC